jgi:hypothetical protein
MQGIQKGMQIGVRYWRADISLAFIHYEALCSDFFIPLIPFIPVSPKLSLSA